MTPTPLAMRAVEIATHGGPEVLRLVERPVPSPGTGQVLIKVAAAGINRPDALQRSGLYPPPPGASDLPGLEISGTIVGVAGDGDRSLIGRAVCALVTGGGYAEYCVAEAALCLPIPAGFSMIEAAATPENWFTVWDHVVRMCRLQPKESILIHGGTSGIGITALQLAKAIGAQVYATAGSDAKAAWLERQGGVRAINYRSTDFVAAIMAASDGHGADVVIDMVGGSYVARNLDALALRGRISIIGSMGGLTADGLSIATIMLKQAVITGNVLRTQPLAYKEKLAADLHAGAWPLFEEGKARPVVERIFPLSEAAAAHHLLESSAHIGKIILEV